jgi:hypothetical protein
MSSRLTSNAITGRSQSSGHNFRKQGRLIDWAFCDRSIIIQVTLTIFAVLAKYGLGLFPSWPSMLAISQYWQHPMKSQILAPPANYVLSSPVSAIAAGILGMKSSRSFIVFHLVLTALAISAFFFMSSVRSSAQLRITLSALMIGGPISAVLLGWVGSYDPVTIIAATMAALAESPIVFLLGWTIFSFNNAPEAAIGLLIYSLVVAFQLGWKQALPNIVKGGIGFSLGYIGIRVLTALWGGSTSRYSWFLGTSRHLFTESWLDFAPFIIFSVLGVGWFVLLDQSIRHFKGTRVLLVISLLAACSLPFIALDQSRVTATVLWPALLWQMKKSFNHLDLAEAKAVARRALFLAVFVVVPLVWNDKLIYTGWRSTWAVVQFLVK